MMRFDDVTIITQNINCSKTYASSSSSSSFSSSSSSSSSSSVSPAQRYPLLSVCAVFPCVQTMVWLPVFGIVNVRTDVDTYDCTRGLYGHRKRVCSESCL